MVIYHTEDKITFVSLKEETFLLEELIVDTTPCTDAQEIRYLLGIGERSIISVSMLERGVANLFKKNRYASICLKLEDGVVGKKLRVSMQPFWIVRTVRVSGLILSKEVYKQYYILSPGDIFDEKEHAYALEQIRNALYRNGYKQAVLQADVLQNEATRTVDVKILIIPGKRFFLGAISLISKITSDEYDDIVHEAESYLRRLIGKGNYSWEQINKATNLLRNFFLKHGICSVKIKLAENVHVDQGSVDLRFLLESFEKRKIHFFGNNFLSHNQLHGIIASFGSSVAVLPFSMIAQEILLLYHTKGFWQAQVQAQEASQDECFIVIQEGSRALIQALDFDGVNVIRVDALRKYISASCVSKFFDVSLIERVYEQVSAWYAQAGFLDAHVVAHECQLNNDALYTLKIFVHEGVQHSVSRIIFDTIPNLAEEEPFAAYREQISKNGSLLLDMNIIQEQKRWLLAYFHERGYFRPEVKYELQGTPDSLTIAWLINPGSLTYFGKTIMQGNAGIPYECIARELQYKEGNIWDDKKLYASLLRLRKLGIFSTVHMYPDHQEVDAAHINSEVERTVILKLCPEDPFELRVRAGFGLQQVGKNFVLGHGLTYKIGGTFLYRNPCKRADYFLGDADFARSHRSIQLEYHIPWIFNRPLHGAVKGYSTFFDQPGFVGSRDSLYRITRHGFSVGFDQCLQGVQFIFNIGFELLKTTIEASQKAIAVRIGEAIHFKPSLLNEYIPYVRIEPTILLDRVDNRLSPTKGSFTLFAMKGMIPLKAAFSEAYLMRLQVEQSLFLPLMNRLIGGIRLRLGHIFHRNFSFIAPAERFYLGGANSVRGYDTDFCPPLGFYKDNEAIERIVPQGGKTMANLNFELRFLCLKTLEFAIFQDMGMLMGASYKETGPHHVAATGCGFRYNTPIGPLRFDLAWKWHTTRKDEHTYAWFLRLGQVF